MNYGLYLSAGGTMHNLLRQDVYANNLANVNTTAFKPDAIHARHRLPERLESPSVLVDPQEMLERLGGGVASQRALVSTQQGNLVTTGQALDVAIEGEGYFTVRDAVSGGGAGEIFLTRDGRFALNQRGELIMSDGGRRVLDRSDRPIRLDAAAPVTIQGTGEIIQHDRVVAQLRLVAPRDPAALTKEGEGLLRLGSGAAGRRQATGRMVQRHLEASAVDPILTLNDLINATKATQANARLMQYHDHIMGQAINTLGRVA